MVADRPYFTGEKFRLVLPFAARALTFANIENFIHPGVKRIRIERLADFINEREHHVVNLRMPWTIAFAVELVRIGPGILLREFEFGCLIEFRINSQEFSTSRLPRLMPEQIDQWHNPDLMLPANLCNFSGLLAGEPA